ncbi:hypothetical protein FK513_29200, partial [Klebsiella pneumoniae]|uniref:LamB/YcsF family protein n=1 Tax=Klebsiella pneumoniae TaxID=573 RepID=UPI00210910DF
MARKTPGWRPPGKLLSSSNIACGFHAGDAVLMQQCVREALKNGVAIGGEFIP